MTASDIGVPSDSTDEIDGWSALTRRLEEDIALGRLKPRQRLVEGELMLRFHAKRNAVRLALAELEKMGIVQRPPNRGAVVRDFDAKAIEDIYLVRELLETRAAELIPFPLAPAAIQQLKKIHRRHCAASKNGDLASVFRENLAFHRFLFGLCGVPVLVEAIETFQMKSHAIRSVSISNPALLAQVTKEHADMIQALESQDRKGLVRLVAAHLKPAKNAYLQMHVR